MMKNVTNKILLCVLLVLILENCYDTGKSWAVPVYPEPRTLTQPDGTTFTARAFGDENGGVLDLCYPKRNLSTCGLYHDCR